MVASRGAWTRGVDQVALKMVQKSQAGCSRAELKEGIGERVKMMSSDELCGQKSKAQNASVACARVDISRSLQSRKFETPEISPGALSFCLVCTVHPFSSPWGVEHTGNMRVYKYISSVVCMTSFQYCILCAPSSPG